MINTSTMNDITMRALFVVRCNKTSLCKNIEPLSTIKPNAARCLYVKMRVNVLICMYVHITPLKTSLLGSPKWRLMTIIMFVYVLLSSFLMLFLRYFFILFICFSIFFYFVLSSMRYLKALFSLTIKSFNRPSLIMWRGDEDFTKLNFFFRKTTVFYFHIATYDMCP